MGIWLLWGGDAEEFGGECGEALMDSEIYGL